MDKGDEFMHRVDMRRCHWINEPQYYILNEHKLILETDPKTELWSRTYYNMIKLNAPILYYKSKMDGTVTVRCEFKFKTKYDQCGMVVYITEDCWFKVCMEYIDNTVSLLSTVVTMNGYSDWSSMNVSSDIHSMYFRLHRRGYDFKVENSFNGKHFKQMRVFHLDPLGQQLKIGVYACSPLESSFDAIFSEFNFEECTWKEYRGE